MNICVTGCCGFIGSHLVERLISMGHQVFGIDNMSRPARSKKIYIPNFFQMDYENIADCLKDNKIDIIYHLASELGSVSHEFCAAENVLKTAKLIDSAVDYGVSKIIFASSAGVYGDTGDYPATEESPRRPDSAYGASKAAIELFLKASQLSHCILRFSNVYGQHQSTTGNIGIVSVIKERLEKNLPIEIMGGQQTRDFIYISDVVDALTEVLTLEGVFNVGTGIETSIATLLKLLQERTANASEIRVLEPMGVFRSCLCFDKLKIATGWSPKIPLESGLSML